MCGTPVQAIFIYKILTMLAGVVMEGQNLPQKWLQRAPMGQGTQMAPSTAPPPQLFISGTLTRLGNLSKTF